MIKIILLFRLAIQLLIPQDLESQYHILQSALLKIKLILERILLKLIGSIFIIHIKKYFFFFISQFISKL